MSLLAWLGRVLTATLWLAFHLAIGSGLLLLSAFLDTQPDSEPVAVFVRLLAVFWLYTAAWKWFVRGVLGRPEPVAKNKKPTGAEVARSSLGCLANLLPIPFIYRFAGRLADVAWAGLTGPDPQHPARRAAEQGLGALYFALDHAHQWLPAVFAAFFLLVLTSIVRGRRRLNRHRDAHVKGANAETLAKLRSRARGGSAKGGRTDPARRVDHVRPRTGGQAGGREDLVLGHLTWSAAESAWWVQRPDGFAVLVDGTPDAPAAEALTQAHQVVQRSFEVLLRASDAARKEAQSRGVGLPRFTLAAARVSAGETRLHLRCDADGQHEYVVRSTDGLHTFHAEA